MLHKSHTERRISRKEQQNLALKVCLRAPLVPLASTDLDQLGPKATDIMQEAFVHSAEAPLLGSMGLGASARCD